MSSTNVAMILRIAALTLTVNMNIPTIKVNITFTITIAITIAVTLPLLFLLRPTIATRAANTIASASTVLVIAAVVMKLFFAPRVLFMTISIITIISIMGTCFSQMIASTVPLAMTGHHHVTTVVVAVVAAVLCGYCFSPSS